MKLKLTKLIASTIALTIMSTVAIAEDGEEKKGKKKGKGKPAAERPERSKRPEGSRPERSPEEMVKSLKERLANNEKFAEMFTKRNDTDGDGKVSDEEMKAAIAKWAERRKQGGEAGRARGPRPEGGKPKGPRPEGGKAKGPRPEGKKPKGPRGDKKGRPALEE